MDVGQEELHTQLTRRAINEELNHVQSKIHKNLQENEFMIDMILYYLVKQT